MAKPKLSGQYKKTDAHAFLSNLKHRDLKAECISRGLDFEQLAGMSSPMMTQWLSENYKLPTDKELLNKFDKWLEEKHLAEGKTPESHPHLFAPAAKLGHVLMPGDQEGSFKLRKKRLKKVPGHTRNKRSEKDERFGIMKGTKKSLTFDLASQGVELKEAIAQVLAQFPEAQEKSIRIWYKKAKNSLAKK